MLATLGEYVPQKAQEAARSPHIHPLLLSSGASRGGNALRDVKKRATLGSCIRHSNLLLPDFTRAPRTVPSHVCCSSTAHIARLGQDAPTLFLRDASRIRLTALSLGHLDHAAMQAVFEQRIESPNERFRLCPCSLIAR